jgi:hypothetical protein
LERELEIAADFFFSGRKIQRGKTFFFFFFIPNKVYSPHNSTEGAGWYKTVHVAKNSIAFLIKPVILKF